MSNLLKDKVAVITGAGRGIGQATAILFAKEGANVFVTDIDKKPLEETISMIKSTGGIVSGIQGDVTKKEDCERIMKNVSLSSIDILANIAGITRDRVVQKMTLEDWNFIINVNLTGTFNCIQAAEPYMRKPAKEEQQKSGQAKTRSIINVSSTSGTGGNAGQANYAASKAGIIGLTKTIAKEWARFNITCNAVAPGFIETRLTQAKKEGEDFGIPEEQKLLISMLHQQTGLARELGKVEDVAKVILFFASDLSAYVTGQVLTVAGGMIGTI
ncbi:MAG: SDR family oxidoreductase [Candidatus Melainabacteria bacterium]|nr:SDR family oxidoreductase [Candidatus Melainabacteria bacterium]